MGKDGGGGGAPERVTTVAEPWSGQQPYLTDIMGEAQRLYDAGGLAPFPGTTVAPFSPQQMAAMDMTTLRALQGSPLQDAAQQENLGTVSGEYLNNQPAMGYLDSTASGGMLGANPYLEATFDRASRNLMPAINATFGAGGRTGSEAHSSALGTGLADLATGLFGGQYANERALQQNAAGMIQNAFGNERQLMQAGTTMSPGLAQMAYGDMDRLMGVGNMVQGQAQNLIGDDIQRWNAAQQQPYDQLSRYAQTTMGGGNFGGTTTQEMPVMGGGLNLPGMLGGGLMGGMAAPMIGSGLAGLSGGALASGAAGPSALMASGMANPMMLPMIAGGALLGGKL